MVKPVQDEVRHNSGRSVEAMPPALQVDGKIQGWMRKAWPQRRVRSASINVGPTTAEFFEDVPRSRG